jgi:hypothetical protein
MNAQIERLLGVLNQAVHGSPPHDRAAFIGQLPDPGTMPAPWETWILFGLVRHRERQLWVADLIRTRLRGDPSDIGRLGAFGHPEGVKQSGSVPGLPEWEYYFHGRGCCLTHKVNGEVIDVDFWEETGEYFDTFFYTKYVESLRSPAPTERRIRELHPSLRPIEIGISELLGCGALEPLPGSESHPYRVAPEVMAHEEAINQFCQAWSDPAKRLWLSGLIGDWPAAHAASIGQPDIEPIIAQRAERCRQLRRNRLLSITGYQAADALHGLADIGAVADSLAEAFRSPPSGLVSAALAIAGNLGDPRWCPDIYSLHTRVNPAGEIPQPHIWMTSLKFLMRHGYRVEEMFADLARAGGTEVGEAVLLALEHAPEHALPLIRSGLLSDIPMTRTSIAAILALIGKPWSMSELLRCLEWSDDVEKTADARAAILELADVEAEKVVLAWEQQNPHEEEPGCYLEVDGRQLGPFFSIREHALKDRAVWLRYEMDKFHDRVMRVRNVVPPEPG